MQQHCFKLFLHLLFYVILWNICSISRVGMSPYLMWRNVGKDFGKLSWFKHVFQVLCAFCFIHHNQPMLRDHSDSMHSESINTAAAKGCPCKSIFCSDLWVFLLMYQVSFWVFMDSRRNLAIWNLFINSLPLGWAVLGSILQTVCFICANISHHVFSSTHVSHSHF